MEPIQTKSPGLESLRAQGRAPDAAQRRAALRNAAEEFESIFLYQVISAMRQTVPKGGLIEKSSGEEIFEGMLDEEWARKLAGRSGPGSLSEILYRQLSRAMGLEEAPAGAAAEGRSPQRDRWSPGTETGSTPARK